MKNKLFPLLIILMLLWHQNSYSQKLFRQGYIVKKSGESLLGMVEYSSNQDIPSTCVFKRFDIARPVVYSPEEISAFGYRNGNSYETKVFESKYSFYEVIIKGRITLYTKKGKFYLEKDHLGLVELKNGPITYPSGEGIKDFRSLSEFLGFITEGKTGIIPSRFNIKNEITRLITLYDSQSGSQFNVFNRSITEKQMAEEANRSGINKNIFGVVSGVDIYMLRIKPQMKEYFPDPEKESGLVYGLTFERIVSRKTDRVSLTIDLLYNSQSFYCFDERENSSGTSIFRSDAFFNFKGVRVPVMLQYSFNGRRLIPFIDAGFSYLYLISKDYLRIEEAESFDRIYSVEYKNMKFRPGELSLSVGAGVKTRVFNNINLHLQGNIGLGPGIFKNTESTVKEFNSFSVQSTFMVGLTF